MAAAQGRQTSRDPWTVAAELADTVAAGGALPQLASCVLLESDEVLHADLEAAAWRYEPLDLAYPQHRSLAVGGSVIFGLTAAATAIGNRRARRDAERLAAPQWRSLGLVPVLATSHRLLVFHQQAWASVWYEAIRQLRPVLADRRLELIFENDSPYALHGPWVPCLAVVVATVLAGRAGTDSVVSALLPA